MQRQLVVLVLGLVAVILFINVGFYFSDILRILAFSVLFSYLFINVVDWLEQICHNRAISIMIVYLVLAVLIVIGFIIVVPAVLYQITQLLDTTFNQIPQWIEYLVKALRPLEQRLHAAQIQVKAIDILSSLATSIPKPDPALIIGRMTDVAMSTLGWLFYGLSIIVVSFYFMLDGHRIKEGVIAAFPRRQHAILGVLATDMDRTLQAFFRGQIVLGLFFGAAMLVVYLVLGVHYALLLAVFLAFWEIVPVIGPTIGFIPTVISVAVDGMDMVPASRIVQVLIVVIVFNLIQWLKDNFVAPKYMGNVIGLHPVMIFIAIMLGARLDGVSGIIWSLPVACVVNVLVSHLSLRFRAETLAQDARDDQVAIAHSSPGPTSNKTSRSDDHVGAIDGNGDSTAETEEPAPVSEISVDGPASGGNGDSALEMDEIPTMAEIPGKDE